MFGWRREAFYWKNKNKCFILIEREKYDLIDEIKLNKNLKNKKTLKIKLVEIEPITDMSYMFYNCDSLISVPDIDKWDTKNVTNM